MQKRGQVYLLAALIIGFILFTLVAQSNIVKRTIIEDDFEELSKNYERESAHFVNGLLEKGTGNVEQEFIKFTILFTSFAKTKNPEFGLLYAFLHQGTVYVGNYLDTAVTIQGQSASLPGCYAVVNATVAVAGLNIQAGTISVGRVQHCTTHFPPPTNNEIKIVIEQIPYVLQLTEDAPDIMLVSRETKDQQRKVYVKSNLLKH